jgi:uncharacterized protein YbjT (DUF2867 family)
MARLLVTGASGYIGRRLVQLARSQGHEVVTLGRDGSDVRWSQGEPVPEGVFVGVDGAIHLAHSWEADAKGNSRLNGDSSEALARAALDAMVPRFVFASTNSARAEARNAYGREKFATEARLAGLPGAAGRLVSARIGLVYGGVPSGQYAMMRKLTRLTPLLPMIGLDRQVQPIDLDEVCAGLITLATRPDLTERVYILAGAPMRFDAWLTLLRRAQTGGGLVLVPLPLGLILTLSRLGPKMIRERLLGLAAASPVGSATSLKALGLSLADPAVRLDERSQNEVRALLIYMGAKPVTTDMEADLAKGMALAGLGPMGLSHWLVHRPRLLILVDPPANCWTHRLGMALHLASQVVVAHQGEKPRSGPIAIAGSILTDLLARPFRLFFGRYYR